MHFSGVSNYQVHITTNRDNYAILLFDLFLSYVLIEVSGTQKYVKVHMHIMSS